jgi:hypothetical protein
MMMNRELIQAKLDLIAARAVLLAQEYKENRLWGGELHLGLGEVASQANTLLGQTRDDP